MTSSNTYASAAAFRRALKITQQSGILVGTIFLHPNGTIELTREGNELAKPANDFDRLDAEGRL